MRKVRLIHILLFSFIVTTVALIGIIAGSWRLIALEAEESARSRMRNMISDTAAALGERAERLREGSTIACSFPEIREFMAGDEGTRFRLKTHVRAELQGFLYYETGAAGAYLRTADGAELPVASERSSFESVIPYLVQLQVSRDYQVNRPFRRQIVTDCYPVGTRRFFALLTPLYPEQEPPTDRNYLGALVLIMDAEALWSAVPESAQGNILAVDGAGIVLDSGKVREEKARRGETALLSMPVPQTGWTVSACPEAGAFPGLMKVFQGIAQEGRGDLRCFLPSVSR